MRAILTSRGFRLIALLAGMTLLGHDVPFAAAGPDVAVIVAPGNPTRNLTIAELRRLFRGEQGFWPDGTAVVPILPVSGTVEKATLLATTYRLDEADLRRFWIAKVYEGVVAQPPPVATPGPETITLVTHVAGAIAVVAADRVPSRTVNVLAIDGRLPGEPGYLLRTLGP